MKKLLKALYVFTAVSTLLTVTLNLEFRNKDDMFVSLSIENVEALASSENSSVVCLYSGSVDCPHSGIKVLYVQ